ncbi:MAG TPA: SUMF1/EgtB/PvdO family nonheme iron enzyme [Verrucomicrobiae bacterium]|nr:SUMF1/EgtB/PvdO family nonheme iron enzyme [Verrucomicrobiae bacterium]
MNARALKILVASQNPKRHLINILTSLLLLTWCINIAAAAQGTRFFRISGPALTTITAFRPGGTMVWSNAQPGAIYTVQTVSSLLGGNSWVDYVQLPTTNSVNTNRLIDLNPPAGMTLIPAGVSAMGDNLDGESDAVSTNVTVAGFYMDVNLVSYSQWQSVYNWATNHGYSFDYPGSGKAVNHPVQLIDWYDSAKWCNARSEMESLTPAYYTDAAQTVVYRSGDDDLSSTNVNWDAGYRLPTEAEWEKAARGGLNAQRFPWGNMISESQANYKGTNVLSYDLGPNGFNAAFTNGVTPYTSPVGYFAANGYGLYDMAGNVLEWCWDWYVKPYAGGGDPHGPESGFVRVLRGGLWYSGADLTRCADRQFTFPDFPYFGFGFRCVRGL